MLFRSLDDPAYVHRRILLLSLRARRLDEVLSEFVPSTTDEVRALQLEEHGRLKAWLAEQVDAPLRAAKEGEGKREIGETTRALEQIDAAIDRIETAAGRLPSIGLVTDRGAGGA